MDQRDNSDLDKRPSLATADKLKKLVSSVTRFAYFRTIFATNFLTKVDYILSEISGSFQKYPILSLLWHLLGQILATFYASIGYSACKRKHFCLSLLYLSTYGRCTYSADHENEEVPT